MPQRDHSYFDKCCRIRKGMELPVDATEHSCRADGSVFLEAFEYYALRCRFFTTSSLADVILIILLWDLCCLKFYDQFFKIKVFAFVVMDCTFNLSQPYLSNVTQVEAAQTIAKLCLDFPDIYICKIYKNMEESILLIQYIYANFLMHFS